MNNLKFRAWDKTAKKMSKVTAIDFSTKPFRVFYKAYGNENYFNKDAILMQSTGLKDKNGKEIFEGDIVRGVFSENHEIVWRKEHGCWVIQTAGTIGLTELAKYNKMFEVIGNIYEDKELLG